MRRSAGLREQAGARALFPLKNMKGIEIEPVRRPARPGDAVDGPQARRRRARRRRDACCRSRPLRDPARRRPAARVAARGRDHRQPAVPRRRSTSQGARRRVRRVAEAASSASGSRTTASYWFRKAHDHLEPDGRAGLVVTNSISQNRARGAESRTRSSTTAASSRTPCRRSTGPGEAAVDVSIVNWVKNPSPSLRSWYSTGNRSRGYLWD